MRQRPLLARFPATSDVVRSPGVALAVGALAVGALVFGTGPLVARAQEPAAPVEILDPFVSPVVTARRATPELIDPFPARLPATRARAVVRAASELLDPFVAGAVSAVSELLDPWAP